MVKRFLRFLDIQQSEGETDQADLTSSHDAKQPPSGGCFNMLPHAAERPQCVG